MSFRDRLKKIAILPRRQRGHFLIGALDRAKREDVTQRSHSIDAFECFIVGLFESDAEAVRDPLPRREMGARTVGEHSIEVEDRGAIGQATSAYRVNDDVRSTPSPWWRTPGAGPSINWYVAALSATRTSISAPRNRTRNW